MPRASHSPPRARTRGPSGSAFDQYLLDIRKLPLITDPREERRLALKARKGDPDAAARLVNAGHPEVIHLKGGLEAWRAAGFPVELNRKAPISLMRQVQIVVGTLVLATVILGVTVSPWFLALTGFFGAGLLFAGLSGTCGMAAVLALMPWNRAGR